MIIPHGRCEHDEPLAVVVFAYLWCGDIASAADRMTVGTRKLWPRLNR